MNSFVYKIGGLAMALVATLLAAACSRVDGTVVGRGGTVAVDADQVKAILADLPEDTRASLGADRAALERVVRAELVRQTLVAEAKNAKLDADADVARQLDRARDDALMRAWMARQATVADDYPSDQELELAYQRNLAALTPPPQYRVAQIFINAPNGVSVERLSSALRKAAEVGSRIPGGDFATLAREYSEHKESASKGGEVGFVPANQLLPEVATALGKMSVGETIGPLKTSQGLHFVKLLEKKGEPAPSLDAVRDQLRTALRTRRKQELEQAYLEALKTRMNVAIDQVALAEIDGISSKNAAR